MPIYNKKIETMNRKELTKLQLQRLKNMVDYCINNVPFYKKKLEEAGILSSDAIKSISDISKIPFTTKEELQREYPNGLLAVPMNKVSRIHSSSGTKNTPTIGYYTKKDIKNWTELCARVLCQNGIIKNDIVQISMGYGLFTGGLGFHQSAEKIGCTVIPLSTGNTKKQLKMMKDIGTTVLIATPSYALYISELIKESKEDKFKIKKVFLGSERCTNNMRKMIENNIGCTVSDNYGLTECFGPGISGECMMHNGMHISEDMFYPEIINPNTGEVETKGLQGELVLTSLLREAMPILRYKTGDITSLNFDKCECGRTTVRMQSPSARIDDMFVFKGVNIYPTQIEYVIENIEELNPYYLVKIERKNNKDIATLYIELEKNIDEYLPKDITKLQEKISKKILESILVKFDIELLNPNTLERVSGKTKHVDDLRYNQ